MHDKPKLQLSPSYESAHIINSYQARPVMVKLSLSSNMEAQIVRKSTTR